MKFLHSLLEQEETVYSFHVEVFDEDGNKVDDLNVLATNEEDAEFEAIRKSTKRGNKGVSALAVDKEEIEDVE